MPLHFIPLALTILVVLLLGIIAAISSTSGGAEWLQRQWKRGAAAPDQGDGRATRSDGSGADGLAGAADALGDAVEGRYRADGAQERRLPRHPVDDA
jgi:hypothetical protein